MIFFITLAKFCVFILLQQRYTSSYITITLYIDIIILLLFYKNNKNFYLFLSIDICTSLLMIKVNFFAPAFLTIIIIISLLPLFLSYSTKKITQKMISLVNILSVISIWFSVIKTHIKNIK